MPQPTKRLGTRTYAPCILSLLSCRHAETAQPNLLMAFDALSHKELRKNDRHLGAQNKALELLVKAIQIKQHQ